jgi:lipid A ethanolaminephosphotransferase
VSLYNEPLWQLLLRTTEQGSSQSYLFIASFFTFLVFIFFLLLNLISVKYLHKPLAISLIISAAMASYFMTSYGIVFDKTMIQNTLETDSKEVVDLISPAMFLNFCLYGLLPATILAVIKVRYQPLLKECRSRILLIIVSVLVIAANLGLFYKDYSSTFRNNREIRNMIIPSSYIYYTAKYLSGAYEQRDTKFLEIAQDAQLGAVLKNNATSDQSSKDQKKLVTVIVVGETARAQNFSFNGYQRDTNPELSKQDVVNFSDTSACGTSTAVSLPCMFSVLQRSDFDTWQASNTENLLDILKRVGFDVLWRENNSGCKGVCTRVDNQPKSLYMSDQFCEEGRCLDEILLTRLDEYMSQGDANKVIVLHQNGSHGPSYYKRYPKAFEKFTPTCQTADLSSCSKESILNSYDNSILYTDYFLVQVIKYLAERSDTYNSAMIYISDHGESLGENNIYLHGLPYYMAPDTQKKVPFITWLSKGYKERLNINQQCLTEKSDEALTHGNLFHSILGLLDVQTKVYNPDKDVFASCRF